MTPAVGALRSGERLLSRLAGEPKEAFILACLADRRIFRTELTSVSGYSAYTLRWLARALKVRPARQSRRRDRVVDDVYQALLICASRVSSRTLGHKGFSLLAQRVKRCETGLCDDVMLAVQEVFDAREANPTAIAAALGKSRHWYYVNKQSAVCECQTLAKCKNWSNIVNAFEHR